MSRDANRAEVGWGHPDAHRVITQQRDEAQRELQASREEIVALQHRLDEAHAEILALRKRDPVIQRALNEADRETHPIERATRQEEGTDELAPKFQVSHDPWNNADARNQGSQKPQREGTELRETLPLSRASIIVPRLEVPQAMVERNPAPIPQPPKTAAQPAATQEETPDVRFDPNAASDEDDEEELQRQAAFGARLLAYRKAALEKQDSTAVPPPKTPSPLRNAAPTISTADDGRPFNDKEASSLASPRLFFNETATSAMTNEGKSPWNEVSTPAKNYNGRTSYRKHMLAVTRKEMHEVQNARRRGPLPRSYHQITDDEWTAIQERRQEEGETRAAKRRLLRNNATAIEVENLTAKSIDVHYGQTNSVPTDSLLDRREQGIDVKMAESEAQSEPEDKGGSTADDELVGLLARRRAR